MYAPRTFALKYSASLFAANIADEARVWRALLGLVDLATWTTDTVHPRS